MCNPDVLSSRVQLKKSELQERLKTLELEGAEHRRQLDLARSELDSLRTHASESESAVSEAAGLRRALADAQRQINGAGVELSELTRQLAEAKGQRDASQVRVLQGHGVAGVVIITPHRTRADRWACCRQ